MKKILCVLMSSFILSGCLSPAKITPANEYVLNKIPAYVPTKKTRPIILLVAMPDTNPIYNTTQMAYTVRPYQISYFALNQWAEAPSEMFQPLLVQTMQNTHHFKAVVVSPYTGRYDYTLNTEIQTLLQDYTCPQRPVFVLKVRAQILKMSTGRVVGTREFYVAQPLMQKSPYGGVFAGNDAMARVLEEIAEFCLGKMG